MHEQQQGGIGSVSDGPPKVFDRNVKRLQRDAAASRRDREDFSVLRNEIAERLAERLDDTVRKFPTAADVGCADGALLRVRGNLAQARLQYEHARERVGRT